MLAVKLPTLTVGEAFRVLREGRGLSLDEVVARAKKKGHTLGRSTVYSLEDNTDFPSSKSMFALADAFDIGLARLLAELASAIEPDMPAVSALSPRALALATLFDSLGERQQDALWTVAEGFRHQEGTPP